MVTYFVELGMFTGDNSLIYINLNPVPGLHNLLSCLVSFIYIRLNKKMYVLSLSSTTTVNVFYIKRRDDVSLRTDASWPLIAKSIHPTVTSNNQRVSVLTNESIKSN